MATNGPDVGKPPELKKIVTAARRLSFPSYSSCPVTATKADAEDVEKVSAASSLHHVSIEDLRTRNVYARSPWERSFHTDRGGWLAG